MRSFVFASALVVAVVCSAVAQHGAATVPRNLAQLTDTAAVIVEGRVVSAYAEPHPKYPNLMTVVVTVAVEDTLKGEAQKVRTFRQYVWDERDARSALGYRKGQHVLLLLNPENENGLTSTVGLQQGRFRIQDTPAGVAMAVNGDGNQFLMQGVAEQASRRGVQLSQRATQLTENEANGPIRLRDLKEMIRGLARTK